MNCYKCGSSINVEEHHVEPRFMNNPSGNGNKIDLCKKCHNILHLNIIPLFLFNRIEDKDEAILELKRLTYNWITNINEEQLRCSQCNADLDIEDKICPYCNKLNEVDDGYS